MLDIYLPLAGITVWAPGVVLLGFGIGFLTGMFGAGGGFILTPFLKIVFGIPYPVAVGSGLVQMLVNSLLSTYGHWRNRSIDLKLGVVVVVGAVVGTETGVRLQRVLDLAGAITIGSRSGTVLDVVLNGLFIVLMTVVAVTIWRETSKATGQEARAPLAGAFRSLQIAPMMHFGRSGIGSMSLWPPLVLSFFVGNLTGLLGVGGGFVTFPVLVYLFGVPTLIAVGTSAFQIMFASAYGAFRHAVQGHVEPILAGLLLLGSIAGVMAGVHVSHCVGGRTVRRWFGLVLCAGILLILWDFVR